MTATHTLPNHENLAAVARILDQVREHTGLYFRDEELPRLLRLLTEHATQQGMASLCAYAQHLSQGNKREIEELACRLTIQETSFFRQPYQFQALGEIVLPDLLARRKTTRTLSFWSAGCAMGAEPYSLAMILQQTLGATLSDWCVRVWATDLDPVAIEVARAGLYAPHQLRGLSKPMLARYFGQEGELLRLDPQIRRMVTFDTFNLNAPWAWDAVPRVDVIFCRNVIIYFAPETNRALLQRFRRVLADDGYLFLGHAETLWDLSDDYAPVFAQGTFVYQPKPTHTCKEKQVPRKDLPPPAEAAHRPRPLRKRRHKGTETSHPRPMRTRTGPYTPQARSAPPSPTAGGAEGLDAAIAASHALLQEGLNAEALSLLTPYLVGQSAEAHLLAARALANRGEIIAAAQQCDRAVNMDPLLGEAYYLGGILALAHGNLAGADLAFERLVYLKPKDPLAHYYLALVYQRQQRVERAMRSYRNALKLTQDHPAEEVLEEMSIGLLRLACQRGIEQLSSLLARSVALPAPGL